MREPCLLQGDRYLPFRKINASEHSLRRDSHSVNSTTASKHYRDIIASSSARCLTFSKATKESSTSNLDFTKSRRILTEADFQGNKRESQKMKQIQAQKIVEVPGFQNNFYFSSFDQYSNSLLGMAIREKIYLYNPKTEASFELNQNMFLFSHYWQKEVLVTSLKFNHSNPLLFAGKQDGTVDLLDLNKLKTLRSLQNHLARVGCIENTEEWGFLSGSKDKTILHNDIRVKKSCILKVLTHNSQVCGLAFKNSIVASGSSDGRVNIWDLKHKKTFMSKRLHQSAAKALEWCPWKVDLLASGSGSKNPQIVFWNNNDQTISKILNPNSQVTALKWRQLNKDIVSVHGSSQGYIWNIETGQEHTRLSGHQGRILGLSIGKDETLWTIGADQTMRFWKTGSEVQSNKSNRKSSMMDLIMR